MNFKEQIEANFEKATNIIKEQQEEIQNLTALNEKLKEPAKKEVEKPVTPEELTNAIKYLKL